MEVRRNATIRQNLTGGGHQAQQLPDAIRIPGTDIVITRRQALLGGGALAVLFLVMSASGDGGSDVIRITQ